MGSFDSFIRLPSGLARILTQYLRQREILHGMTPAKELR
jgi:hypothetical protein